MKSVIEEVLELLDRVGGDELVGVVLLNAQRDLPDPTFQEVAQAAERVAKEHDQE